jgi:hypothetical protein
MQSPNISLTAQVEPEPNDEPIAYSLQPTAYSLLTGSFFQSS